MMQLRAYQTAAVAAIPRFFERASGNPLIVVPTAGGKSLIAAAFIRNVLTQWPDERIIIVTHVRELISQNHAELMALWPEAPAGIYSAGIGRREAQAQVLLCGIQSVHHRAEEIGHVDLVLIDEAHLVPRSGQTMYRRFLDDLAAINPKIKIIGLTATPFRLDSGLLHEGDDRLFTDIAFEVNVRDLIEQGYLAPLVGKATATKLDTTGVGTRGGDFIQSELERAFDLADINRAVVDEVLRYGADRRSWLLFCSGVRHAEHIAEEVERRGISCGTIFGHTPKDERDATIAAFKAGELRALASMGVLTTGFNAQAVDLIALLRPTKSPGLYVQMMGRGTRLAPGKRNCAVLDFAGNIQRHGPLDQVRPRKPGEAEGKPPTKTCPECATIVAAAALECPECGFAFPERKVKLAPKAADLEPLSLAKPQWLTVDRIEYAKHTKPDGPPSLRVDYFAGLVRHSEWVCLQHRGYPREKAFRWWRQRSQAPGLPPGDVAEALARVTELREPREIRVKPTGRYFEVDTVKW